MAADQLTAEELERRRKHADYMRIWRGRHSRPLTDREACRVALELNQPMPRTSTRDSELDLWSRSPIAA